ncbi:MBL fold metallo-hydrolase [Bacillus sp. N9]
MIPLGVGDAHTKQHYHSNVLLDFNGTRVLIDAGTTLRYSLQQAAVEPETIQYIFITHFHHDHAGGLAEFLTTSYWRFIDGKHSPHRPTILYRPNQLCELDGILTPALNNQGLTWKDYCLPIEIKNNVYNFPEHMLKVIPTDSLHCEGLNSCGLKFINEKVAKISSYQEI